MSKISYVIKRQGKRPPEAFSRTKLYNSIMATCLSVRTPEGQAETTANSVCETVIQWLGNKPEVTSDDIRRKAGSALDILHPEAAHLYKHHHLII